jgi:hypothetical protein
MDIHGTMYRQEVDLISLISFLKYKETRLKKGKPCIKQKTNSSGMWKVYGRVR